MLKRVPDAKGVHKYTSKHGWFYIGWNGDFYTFHIEMGRVGFTVASSKKRQMAALERRQRSKN